MSLDASDITEPVTDDALPDQPLAVEITAEHSDRVNVAMQQNGLPLVHSVSITNTGDTALHDLAIAVSLDNGESEPWLRHIARIDPGATFRIEPEGLSFNTQRLAGRTEAERTHLRVRVQCGSAMRSQAFAIDMLAFDEWPGTGHWPEVTAAFVLPNHPRVAELLGSARTALGQLSDRDALDGYQSGRRQRAAQIAEACFNAVVSRGIGYINPPASFEHNGQRVRLVDRLCSERLGTCLDLTLLMASLWEQCGLHPLIVLLEGHALPALWTHETHLPETAIDEAARLRNLIELGEIVPVESTLLTHPGARFADAVESAKQRMGNPGSSFCAIDIRACRKRGIRPLPLRHGENGSSVDVERFPERSQPQIAGTTLDRVVLAERAESLDPRGVNGHAEPGGRIDRWRTRLLDLSLRNRLINFRESARTIQLEVPDLSKVEDTLAAESTLTILPRGEGDESFLRQELEARRLYAVHPPAELQKRLLTLFRTARTSVEETGANLLHLALGMLKWYESESSEVARYAPIILLPVQLSRFASGSGYRYELSLSEEPLRPNVTLLEKLRNDFGMDIQPLHGLPEDENGLDVPLILRNFRAAIRDSGRWEVEDSAYLGLFSFNKFLMWRDLTDNLDRLKQNRLVEHLTDPNGRDFEQGPFPRPEDLDKQIRPSEIFCTRDADSSQLAAVQSAAEDKTFVLEGPPGTGKSQTIANIVADSLARGKRVLFVAEKMAALGVVRRRLEEDGLGPFCLELHSAKASKKEVLAQLENAVSAAADSQPADWDQLCKDLHLTRSQLNRYVHELHQVRPTGETLYEVLGRSSLLGDGPRVALPPGDITTTTGEQLAAWRKAITGLIETGAAIDPPSAHRLRGIGQSDWQFGLPAQAGDAISNARNAIEILASAIDALNSAAGLSLAIESLSRSGAQAVAILADQVSRITSPIPSESLLTGDRVTTLHQQTRQAIELGLQCQQRREALLNNYREEFLELNHLVHIDALKEAAKKFFLFRLFSNRRARGALRPYAAAELLPDDRLLADLESAGQLKRDAATLASLPDMAEIWGPMWKAQQTDWAALQQTLDTCTAFHKLAEKLRQYPDAAAIVPAFTALAADSTRLAAARAPAADVVAAWNKWTDAWNQVKRVLHTSGDAAFGDLTSGWLEGAGEVFQQWQSGLGNLDRWCAWRRARDAAVHIGLDDLVHRYESADLARDALSDAFERSFADKWFVDTANQIQSMREFSRERQETLIHNFRLLDRKLIAHTRHVVSARLAAAAPRSSAAVSGQSEMGILRRELEKKRRHLPTRRLIESIPTLIARLKPCFLMSPLSVAQYLDTKLPPFDLVVFDEASQIPVWDSIGAIARGSNVIIVGDSKQLPPTTFFDIDTTGDDMTLDDTAVEDMESILQESNASGVPAMRLRWHYRSRHESLIAFSNHYYYDNSLHTFPSPEERSAQLGVTFRHVADGVYDRGGSRTNRIEAAEVVREVLRLLRSDASSRSIGIVTFNQAQQSLIEDLLDEARREWPEIEQFFTHEADEPVFVKNLESVQGDERDTIIFSVGYGPDQNGRPSMNFGPLNKDGGERRLNVAITRSRRRLMVFSSLRADQIDLRRTQAVGVRHFKTFLDYADRGPRAIAEATEHSRVEKFDSAFEQAVCRALADRGWEVDTQIGCAGYRVDLGVRDPDRPGRYLMGIECDGATYHSARTARDRDRIRQSVLEGLGWQIERVWSTDWRINPERCLERLEVALKNASEQAAEATSTAPASDAPGATPVALADSDAHEPPADAVQASAPVPSEGDSRALYASVVPVHTSPPPPAPPLAAPPALPTYVVAAPPDRRIARMDIFDDQALPAAVRALGTIVQIEGPVAEELAIRRMAEWFGVQRVTARFRDRFDVIRLRALSTQPIAQRDDTFWPSGLSESDFTDIRVCGDDPASRRDLSCIPLIERANAVLHILKVQFGLPYSELQRELARLFGTQRLTPRIAHLADEAIAAALATGRARRDNDQISLNV